MKFVAHMWLACSACVATPSDDPADWKVDTSVEYDVSVDAVTWVVPSAALPEGLVPMASNNNVDIEFFKGRLYMAWRSAPTHFASEQTQMFVMSTDDDGETWRFETSVALGSDVREPRLYSVGSTLHLIFFQGGTNPLAFEPQRMWSVQCEKRTWTEPEIYWDVPTVPWDIKRRNGKYWMTSYAGEHYSGDENPQIELFFEQSDDGENWRPVGSNSTVYVGGVSEAAFEFDELGKLWAVTRNEDGDATGFGSHVCVAPSDA